MQYRNLRVWQKAHALALEVYKLTRSFPRDELYGVSSQLRRAVLSVPTNLVEGYARRGDKELARFVNISLGSLAEVEYLLEFSRALGYLNQKDFERIEASRDEVGKLLWAFYRKLFE
ncbi:MAG: four helix bundle protein [Acidobacteriia bacterium]|nr:four helix bundle protein [Terriglobia bacterium]